MSTILLMALAAGWLLAGLGAAWVLPQLRQEQQRADEYGEQLDEAWRIIRGFQPSPTTITDYVPAPRHAAGDHTGGRL